MYASKAIVLNLNVPWKSLTQFGERSSMDSIPPIKHTWSFIVNPSLMTINASNGVPGPDVATALRLETSLSKMSLVSAAWDFASDVLELPIDLVIATQRRNGKRRTEMSQKTLLGWLQTQNLAPILNVGNRLRKTKAVITWHVQNAVINSVGFVLDLGRNITKKLVDTTSATSTKRIKRQARINLHYKSRKMLRTSWRSTCSFMIDTKTTSLQTSMPTKWDLSFKRLFKSWTKTSNTQSQS